VANPVFVNGPRTRGGAIDATGQPGPSEGRLGFDRKGRLLFVFETPGNLIPKLAGGAVDLPGRTGRDRHLLGSAGQPRLRGNRDHAGREEALRGPARSARRGARAQQRPRWAQRPHRRVRQRPRSWTFGTSIAQYAYQLEKQADILARITASGGKGSATDPRQGREGTP
jgi:hypothetical protein